jgi:HK97 family phage major capsid protein
MTKHFAVPGSVLAVLAIGAPSFAFLFNDPPNADEFIANHRDRQAALVESMQAINARAEAESRDLTADEQRELDGLSNEFDDRERQIQLRDRANAQAALLQAPRPRQTEPDPAEGDDPQNGGTARPQNSAQPQRPAARTPARPNATAGGTMGFRHLGEFANSVRLASMRGGEMDPRLRNAAVSTYGNEGSGADGGFAVPPDYRTEILTPVFNEESLVALTDRLQSSSNTLTIPKDETTPWQSTGGIQAYWTAEAGTKTQSKPSLGESTVKLHTLAVLVPVTEELLEDAPAMGAYLNRKAPEKIDFKVSDAIVRGSGAGMPLGILNSPALVTVAAEAAQTSTTVVVNNFLKMWGRMPAASRRTAIWLMHPDVEATLPGLAIGNIPVYIPPGGLSGNQYGTLFGRPVMPHQVANTLGALGDVILFDPKQYLTVTKTGGGRDSNGIKTDVSIHLWFDQDMTAFRFTLRVAGMPWWSAAITQRSGSNAQSPYITLAAR